MACTRIVPRIIVAVGILLGSAVIGAVPAAAGPVPAQHAAACRAVNVVGMTIQAAKQTLTNNGCHPGGIKDGRRFVIRTRCAPVADFGLIVDQKPRGQLLGPKQVLNLWKGVRGTGPDGICNELPYLAAPYDGRYVGTFTIEVINDPQRYPYPIGLKAGGVAFTVEGGKIKGDVTGTINAAGVSNDARFVLDNFECQVLGGGMTFGNGLANAQVVRCGDGNAILTGPFTAWAQ